MKRYALSIISLLSSLIFSYALFFYMNDNLGILILPNTGKSMEPTLVQGDLLVFRSIEVKDLEEKKIICLDFNKKRFIVHRIEEVLGDERKLILTKGDNEKYPDMPSPSIYAKWAYVFHVPLLGHLFLKKFLGIQLIFFVLAGNLIVTLLILFKYKK